ncbi:MAG TPA: M20/M25/M40 family metallo-hydrolase, partial [Candidatus Syntrophosphaera sp.]|nr:M20/M25/M40 family metallo-hydrolase [Candidatus Syntrophosphaera sp.]
MKTRALIPLLLAAFSCLLVPAAWGNSVSDPTAVTGKPDPACFPASSKQARIDVLDIISQVNADTLLCFIQTLQDFGTRHASAPNHWAVANWIKDEFVRFGFGNAYLFDFFWSGSRQFNPLATLTGSVYPDIYILVGGHHDSTNETDPLTWAPGADDNGSGAAATLEMARVLSLLNFQPRCSIIFTTFAGEEVGQRGSQAYVQHALTDSLDIRLVINMDMIGNNNPGTALLKIMRYDASLQHAQLAASFTTLYTDLDAVWSYHNYSGTDSYSFWQGGFPVFTVSEYDSSPWWHTGGDTTEHIDAAYCAEVARAVLATAVIYANMPLAPESLYLLDTGTGNSLLVGWEASPDPLTAHYNLYRGPAEDELVFWQSTPDTQCLLSGLAEGDSCWVGISALAADGSESYWITACNVPLSVPRIPAGLVETPEFHAVRLDWSPNAELDLAGYRIFRSLSCDEAGICIASVNAPQTSYMDADLPGPPDYYYYRICAFDTEGNQSPLSELVRSRPVSLDRGILVVDETRDFSGGSPFQPTDAMVDGFYDALLAGFETAGQLDLADSPEMLSLADIGIYSSMLWHGNDSADLSYPAGVREVLRRYIELGGKILFSVYQPGTAFEYSAGYPATFAPESFISEVLGIGGADYDVAARFKYARPCLPNWPLLEVDSLKTLPALNGHIFRVESIIPAANGAGVYAYGSDYAYDSPQGSLNGDCVGVLGQFGAGQSLTLSFPLYHMREDSARAMAQYVFGTLFGEPTPVPDGSTPVPGHLSLLPNRPNPFSARTTLSFRLPVSGPASLRIYNLKGQLVRTLLQGERVKGVQRVDWDGKD